MKTHSTLFTFLLCAPLALAEPPTNESLALKDKALEGQVESLDSDLDAANKEKDGVAGFDKAKHPDIIINIHKDGKIRVEGLELGDKELTARIEPILKKFPNQPIRIRAIGEVTYQDVVRVIDLCQRAGARNISFVTVIPKDEVAVMCVSANGEAIMAIYSPETARVFFPGKPPIMLYAAESASGARYTNNGAVWWEHQGEVTYKVDGVILFRGDVKPFIDA